METRKTIKILARRHPYLQQLQQVHLKLTKTMLRKSKKLTIRIKIKQQMVMVVINQRMKQSERARSLRTPP